jgi:hypothetical protein
MDSDKLTQYERYLLLRKLFHGYYENSLVDNSDNKMDEIKDDMILVQKMFLEDSKEKKNLLQYLQSKLEEEREKKEELLIGFEDHMDGSVNS